MKEGNITRACQALRLSQPTVSTQIKALEKFLGEDLFERQGRNLKLTDIGGFVYEYADQIFGLGGELLQAIRDKSPARALQLRVGITDAVPKLVAYHLIKPALGLGPSIRLSCVEGKVEKLLAELSVYELDLVISDSVMPPVKIKAYSHLLGECGVSFFGVKKIQERYRKDFPRSLNGAPVLLPIAPTPLRRSFDQWCITNDILPDIAGEFQDTALLMSFGESGRGVFFAPSVIETAILSKHEVRLIGRAEPVRQSFYAISVERKIKHPAVTAICAAARSELFYRKRK